MEDLQSLKRDKTFLDVLAISDGRKKIRAKSKKEDAANKLKSTKDSTFMTTVGN